MRFSYRYRHWPVHAEGSAAALFMGASAASNQAKDIIERGGSNKHAFWGGLAAGAAEVVFEKVSIDQLLSAKSVTGVRSWLKETVKQAGVEASEEMLTEVANILSDAAIMGNSSNYAVAVSQYMQQGMTEEQAKNQAFLDCVKQVALAGAGGALSGMAMGGVVNAYNRYSGAFLPGSGLDEQTLRAELPNISSLSLRENAGNTDGKTDTTASRAAPTVDTSAQNAAFGGVGTHVSPQANIQRATAQGAALSESENKTASTGEAESTVINTDPAQHTAVEQAVIEEYQAAVDDNLVNFVETALENKDSNKGKYTLKPVSEKAAADIKALTGVDTSGFKTVLEQRIAEHIVDRHGVNGIADNSMSDINDIARMQYVLDNYDSMEDGGYTRAYTTNKTNGRPGQAKTVLYVKAVNGTYYVVEAVPDTKAKTTFIVSAYMSNTKTGDSQTTDAKAPAWTAKTENANSPVSATTVPQQAQGVKGQDARNNAGVFMPGSGLENVGAGSGYNRILLPNVKSLPLRNVDQSPAALPLSPQNAAARQSRGVDEEYQRNVDRPGQSYGGEESQEPGAIEQTGTVDFSDWHAVWEQLTQAQADFADLDYEMNCTITADGRVWRVSGTGGEVNPWGIEQQGGSLKGSFSYHNHPPAKTWYSFSAEDVRFFFSAGEECAMASDDKFEYIMCRTEETLDIDPDVAYHRFKEIFNTDVSEMAWDKIIDREIDGFHETMKRLSQEYKFGYVRVRRNGGK